jgi:hypothetical protein
MVYITSTLLHWFSIMGHSPSQLPVGQGPRFHVETKAHPEGLLTSLHRFVVRKRKPHDEREYAWLEYFLKVVVYMEGEFGAMTSG